LTAALIAAVLFSAGSLDSLDACLQGMQNEISRLEEEEAALSTILDAIHVHLLTSREYYNELALEEARILQQLSRVSSVFTEEDSLREALVESLSSYMLYLYSHRNLGGVGSFFVEGGFRRMLHRQAYVDYLASKAAGEVYMLSMSQDSLGSYRDSLEVLLLNVQELRRQMEDIQEGIYQEEARQASMRSQVMGRIAAARESLQVLEDQRIARSRFVTELIVRSTSSPSAALLPEPDSDAYLERQRGSVIWPAEGQVVRRFGIERHPEYGTEITIEGITVVTQPSQDVCASAPGLVMYAREYLSMGQMVVLDHEDGYYSFYGHLGQLSVSQGDVVEAGTRLGRAGSVQEGQPGYYFEIRKGGEPVNPEEYLQ
jgi:murein DD-endopeptidase MepM/ murein hydrolase activator NlpD